tara:strand:+ start:3421 stop:4779 length:1359 start_codon:yes stop_codon:yes gene_type:complete
MNLERFLFKKISLWILLFMMIIFFITSIFFGWVVLHKANGGEKSGIIGDISYEIASIIPNLLKIVRGVNSDLYLKSSRFENLQGLNLSTKQNFSKNFDGYILLSRYDGNINRSIVEIIDIDTKQVIHTYKPDIEKINSESKLSKQKINFTRDKNLQRYEITHPYLDKNGDLIFKNASPLVRIDMCSKLIWSLDGIFHHSTEIDHEGNFWVLNSNIDKIILNGQKEGIVNEAITKVSPSGTIIYEKSIAEIFLENNLAHKISRHSQFDYTDPFHSNDIQPALVDTKFWKKGDLFISLRNFSMIMLFRPSNNKVLWFKEGPWVHQHDVDIISDKEISIYNNNLDYKKNNVMNINNVLIFNFENQKVSSPYEIGFKKNDIKTRTGGLNEILDNGDIFVEEENFGRVLRMDKKGNIIWQYINKADDGNLYLVRWSRFLSEEKYSKIIKNILISKCR